MLAVALGFCGVAALPERMRASNLNLAPLGTGVAALFALALIVAAALRPADAEPGSVERGVSVILIMAWPALAWLLSRERGLSALGLALAVGLLALTRFEDGEAVAMIFGAVAFGAVSANRERGDEARRRHHRRADASRADPALPADPVRLPAAGRVQANSHSRLRSGPMSSVATRSSS